MNFKEFKLIYQKREVEIYTNNVSNKPKVSVCIPTYQHVNYIKECLESVLMQKTTFLIEILLGEDGSNDGTREICLEYAKKYPKKIKLILHNRENNIVVNGRDIGMFNYLHNFYSAKGEYIALLDGDDYWTDPYKLQKQVDFLENNPKYVITYGGVKKLENNQVIDVVMGAEQDLSSEQLMKCTAINTLTACFRNVIKEFPPEIFKSSIGDLFIWSLLGAHGKGKYLDDIGKSIYRVHSGGVFSDKSFQVKKEMQWLTSLALFLYYRRMKNDLISKYFQEEAILNSIKAYGGKSFLKFLFNRIIKRFIK